MSKKKPSSKKHKFKHLEPALSPSSAPRADDADTKPSVSSAPQPDSKNQVTQPRFDYVRKDVRRVTVVALGLLVLEIALYFLMRQTQLGDWVYRAISF